MGEDRRQSDRLAASFETVVRRPHAFGAKRQVSGVLENLSGDGAFVRTSEEVRLGEQVFVVFRLSATGHTGARVAARGRVVRSERQPNGSAGIAVRFSSHRFL